MKFFDGILQKSLIISKSMKYDFFYLHGDSLLFCVVGINSTLKTDTILASLCPFYSHPVGNPGGRWSHTALPTVYPCLTQSMLQPLTRLQLRIFLRNVLIQGMREVINTPLCLNKRNLMLKSISFCIGSKIQTGPAGSNFESQACNFKRLCIFH